MGGSAIAWPVARELDGGHVGWGIYDLNAPGRSLRAFRGYWGIEKPPGICRRVPIVCRVDWRRESIGRKQPMKFIGVTVQVNSLHWPFEGMERPSPETQ